METKTNMQQAVNEVIGNTVGELVRTKSPLRYLSLGMAKVYIEDFGSYCSAMTKSIAGEMKGMAYAAKGKDPQFAERLQAVAEELKYRDLVIGREVSPNRKHILIRGLLTELMISWLEEGKETVFSGILQDHYRKNLPIWIEKIRRQALYMEMPEIVRKEGMI